MAIGEYAGLLARAGFRGMPDHARTDSCRGPFWSQTLVVRKTSECW